MTKTKLGKPQAFIRQRKEMRTDKHCLPSCVGYFGFQQGSWDKIKTIKNGLKAKKQRVAK